MCDSRRISVANITKMDNSNASLWLDKYSPFSINDEGTWKKSHLLEVASISVSDDYQVFFNEWKELLNSSGFMVREAETSGRMIIGLGGENPAEVSITLHHTYGVPYLPASAIKGLLAHYILNTYSDDPNWKRNGDYFKIIFGSVDEQGCLDFADGLLVWDNFNRHPLVADVITPHHPHYYTGTLPPADWDDPKPIPFLTVTKGCKFIIPIRGEKTWVELVFSILDDALRQQGIGAKTAVSYGRLKLTANVVDPDTIPWIDGRLNRAGDRIIYDSDPNLSVRFELANFERPAARPAGRTALKFRKLTINGSTIIQSKLK